MSGNGFPWVTVAVIGIAAGGLYVAYKEGWLNSLFGNGSTSSAAASNPGPYPGVAVTIPGYSGNGTANNPLVASDVQSGDVLGNILASLAKQTGGTYYDTIVGGGAGGIGNEGTVFNTSGWDD